MNGVTRQLGFTAVELVAVIVILGALAGITTLFITQPFEAIADISRRAELVDEADLALDRITREVHTALPNSVRVTTSGDRTAVEFISTRTGGRYRRTMNEEDEGQVLTLTTQSGQFDVLGLLPDSGAGGVQVVPSSETAATSGCAKGNFDCVSIYNTGQSGLNAYEQQNLAAITGTPPPTDPMIASSTIEYDSGGGPAFSYHSPRQRFFVIDDVVSFVCDTGTQELRRRAEYGLKSDQPISDNAATTDFSGATNDLLVGDVETCSIQYKEGPSSRAGLLTLRLELKQGGDSVELIQQVHVMNAP